MAYNKFITTNGMVLLDLTDTSVTAETLAKDVTAVDKNGNKIIGTMVGGGATETDIFASQTVEGFALDEEMGIYWVRFSGAIDANANLQIGQTYFIEWDGETYECVGQDASALMNIEGTVGVGDFSSVGGVGNGEPFVILTYNTWIQFNTFSAGTSHTIRVYQKSEPSVDIQPLDITENGLYTAPDGVAYSPVLVNVPVTNKELFPTEEISPFSQHPELPVYWLAEGHLFTLTIGETYSVDWDGETYTCVAQDLSSMGEGYVGIGNLSLASGSSNNEPFAIVDALTTTMFMSTDTTSTAHTVHVYQKASNVRSTSGIFYGNTVRTIDIDTTMGEYDGYSYFEQSTIYSHLYYWATTATEAITEGEGWSVQGLGREYTATAFAMSMPRTTGLGDCVCLGNANVFDANDTDITPYLIAYSPSANKIAVFTRNKSKAQQGYLRMMNDANHRATIEHGLGVTPDLVIVMSGIGFTLFPAVVLTAHVGFHSKFADRVPNILNAFTFAQGGFFVSKGIDKNTSANGLSADETTFSVGGGSYPFIPGGGYYWLALTGLGE